MDITREYLLEQHKALLQQAEQQQADLNQTLGALRWTEHLLAQLEKAEPAPEGSETSV